MADAFQMTNCNPVMFIKIKNKLEHELQNNNKKMCQVPMHSMGIGYK